MHLGSKYGLRKGQIISILRRVTYQFGSLNALVAFISRAPTTEREKNLLYCVQQLYSLQPEQHRIENNQQHLPNNTHNYPPNNSSQNFTNSNGIITRIFIKRTWHGRQCRKQDNVIMMYACIFYRQKLKYHDIAEVSQIRYSKDSNYRSKFKGGQGGQCPLFKNFLLICIYIYLTAIINIMKITFNDV